MYCLLLGIQDSKSAKMCSSFEICLFEYIPLSVSCKQVAGLRYCASSCDLAGLWMDSDKVPLGLAGLFRLYAPVSIWCCNFRCMPLALRCKPYGCETSPSRDIPEDAIDTTTTVSCSRQAARLCCCGSESQCDRQKHTLHSGAEVRGAAGVDRDPGRAEPYNGCTGPVIWEALILDVKFKYSG